MKRWPMMLGGLLVAGAAVGVAGAVISRRRANRSQWEEYGTTRTTTGRTDSMIESAKSTVETGKDRVQSLAESAKERAADIMGSSSSPKSATSTKATGTAAATAGTPAPEFGSREDLYGKAGTGPNNRP